MPDEKPFDPDAEWHEMWKYHVELVPSIGAEALEARLNDLGSIGWKLVLERNGYMVFIQKRRWLKPENHSEVPGVGGSGAKVMTLTEQQADAILNAIGACYNEGMGKPPLKQIVQELWKMFPALYNVDYKWMERME